MPPKIAYLGPAGTFCEQAAQAVTGRESAWEPMPCPSIAAVFAAVDTGLTEHGIVPVENSCEGSVNLTLDLLAYEYQLEITGEIILPVQHNLLVRPGVAWEEISRVLSHPQALAQCRQYLAADLAGVELVEIPSTAEAACRVSESQQPWAAIATRSAAQAYGLAVVRPEIQDRADNETRFISLSRSDNNQARLPGSMEDWEDPRTSKTSLLLSVGDRPGALFKALEQFYRHDINMSKIESRPAKTRIGSYLFFIDIEGHQLQPRVSQALEGLRGIVTELRVLGSYPTYRQTCALSDTARARLFAAL